MDSEHFETPLDLRINAGQCQNGIHTSDEKLKIQADERQRKLYINTDKKTDNRKNTEQRSTVYRADVRWNSNDECEEQIVDNNVEASTLAAHAEFDTPIFVEKDVVRVTLLSPSLWRTFHTEGTEMIINKSGRRMFPHVEIKVDGLDPGSWYTVCLRMVPNNNRRYKYYQKKWNALGVVSNLPQTKPQIHPDSPALGSHWNDLCRLSFRGVKLSNDRTDTENIVLDSMHKYSVEIGILRLNGTRDAVLQTSAFILPYTEFVAVTAYQNDNITKLKIENNPFARAFKKSPQSGSIVQEKPARKRKLSVECCPPTVSTPYTQGNALRVNPTCYYSSRSNSKFPYVDAKHDYFWGRSGLLHVPKPTKGTSTLQLTDCPHLSSNENIEKL